MKHPVYFRRKVPEQIQVTDVTFHEPDPLILQRLFYVVHASTDKIIQQYDLRCPFGQQPLNDMRPH